MKAVAPVMIVLLLAGCVETADQPDAADVIIDPDRPTETFGDVETGPVAEPDLDATTAAAPELIVGEWWRIHFDTLLSDDTVEVVRVVADVNEDGYIFGMPHEGWLKEAIAFHAPAFGDVAFDLSYNTHNVRFEPVRFPLVTGNTWETSFAATPLVATVESADEYTATVVFRAPESNDPTTPLFDLLFGTSDMTLTYDARQHEVVAMDSAIGTWEVVEHGYDYEGWVTVPRGEHTAIDYGTFGPVTPDQVPGTIDVEGGFNRLTMMHLAMTPENTPGAYTIRDVDPAGNEMLTEFQGAGLEIRFYESNQPEGTWTSESSGAGAGVTYHMGIAYFQYDIHLPDGARRADHGHAVIR